MEYYADKQRGPRYTAGGGQAAKWNANVHGPGVHVFICLRTRSESLKEHPHIDDYTSSDQGQGQEGQESAVFYPGILRFQTVP